MSFDTTLLEEYWHPLCHRSEVSSNNSYLRFETAIGDLVVFNDGIDVVAFDNLCPHRGARIYTEANGRRPATCSYHGWTYRAGRIFIAASERFAKCASEELLPRRYQTEWLGDLLFVAVRPRMSLVDQVGELAGKLRTIGDNMAQRRDLSHYRYECYWPIAVENALEPYHIDKIHPETLGLLRLENGEDRYLGINSVWSAPLGERTTDKKLRSLQRFFQISDTFPGYEFIYLFPFSMISTTFGYSYSIQNFFPNDDGKTNFYSRLFTSRTVGEKADALLDSFFSSTVAVNRKVFEEDHAVCQLVPTRSWTMEPLRFAANSEGKIQHFRSVCRAHLGAA